jgi:hypothetical protein
MSKCGNVLVKQECVETIDYMVIRPLTGKVRFTTQGSGIESGYIVVAGDGLPDGSKISCNSVNSGSIVSKTTNVYAGTPYKMTTIRYMK